MGLSTALWKGKYIPSFSLEELVRFTVTRKNRIKAMSRVLQLPISRT